MAISVETADFRTDLDRFIDSDQTVAVTSHGRTVGIFVPTRADRQAGLEAFETATKRLRDAMAAHGVDEDEIVAEFDAARRKAKTR